MKSYFSKCSYCSKELPLSELEHQGTGFLICKDAVECFDRVNNGELAYITALELELKSLNQKREALICLIKERKEAAGVPDVALEFHKTEMARISAEEA
jgi:ssDNA-binding Zn-finger/Zn-ribbon topoisomerase 1